MKVFTKTTRLMAALAIAGGTLFTETAVADNTAAPSCPQGYQYDPQGTDDFSEPGCYSIH